MGGGTGGREGLGPGPQDALSAEKIEAIGIEYSYLLTSQLDSQRSYYEEQTVELKGQVEQLRGLVEQLRNEFEKEKHVLRESEVRRQEEESARIVGIGKDKVRAEKKAEKMTELARKLDKELREERAVSEGLMKNLEKMKERAEVADTERTDLTAKIAELEDQLRDVMFFLEAKQTIESSEGIEAEAAGGSIEVPKAVGKKKKTTKKG
jgi:BRCA1-associated protein